jgi:hypothetical protein
MALHFVLFQKKMEVSVQLLLVLHLCSHHVKDTLSTFFQPIQLGFGIKGGGKAAVDSIRKYIKNQSDAEVILKIDVKNAFNSVERDSILSMVKDITPDLFPYLWQCYAFQSNLFFNNNIIESLVGCQQGDPLGPAIFSLSIHRIIKDLTSELNIWYLDDGTLGGKASNVLHDLEKIICDFKKIGLTLNFNKCELYFFDSISPNDKSIFMDKFQSLTPGLHICNNEDLKRAFSSANIPCILEPTGVLRDDGKRPDGITIIPWKKGKSLVWDVTCTDTLAPSHLSESSISPKSAANLAAVLNKRKYKSLSDNYFFVAFAVETLGPWCNDALSLLDE